MGGKKKNKADGQADAAGAALRVCGPTLVETLRGQLLGREVALICCGEAHEEAIDLTREKCITEAEEGWVSVDCSDGAGFDPADALSTQGNLTLKGAKAWAERVLAKSGEDSDDEDLDGFLVFEVPPGKDRGSASVFPPDVDRSSAFPLPSGARVLEWGDFDEEAREFNRKRLKGERVPTQEHDALIDARKLRRRREGVEYLDDWALRQAALEEVHVRVLLESPVHPDEVAVHVDGAAGPAPPAHACLRRLEPDSDGDSEDDDDPDDGTGCYADYFYRRLAAALPAERLRGVDPRDLGDAGEESLREAFQKLRGAEAPPADEEEAEVAELPLVAAEGETDSEDDRAWKEERARRLPAVPSWEAFFSSAAELLYYSPQVKADYAPFLAHCIGSPRGLWAFFEALYFGTLAEARSKLQLDAGRRSMATIRSLAYQPKGASAGLFRRPAAQSLIPVRAAPLERCLICRRSAEPRLWLSGLAERVRQAGSPELVRAAQTWFRESVEYLLTDPKEADADGDYFAAWLRACHREIWDDIDRSDPEELKRKEWVPSEAHPKSKKHRHKLGEIQIPGLEAAFKELLAFDGSRASTHRERVLAKIIVDAFQVRSVDLAMVLAVADAVAAAPKDQPVAVVLYAGEDHTKSVAEFWRSRGFTAPGGKGVVGKRDWDDEEPRVLSFPPYLQDVRKLFA